MEVMMYELRGEPKNITGPVRDPSAAVRLVAEDSGCSTEQAELLIRVSTRGAPIEVGIFRFWMEPAQGGGNS